MDFYTLFNVLPAPLLNKTEVKKKYLELSRTHHPDFADSSDEQGMNDALSFSADINKAYKIFSNASLSIQYYLQYKQIIVDDEKFPLPSDFLMDMMDVNEELEEAKASNDENAIAEIRNKMAVIEEGLMGEVKDVLENHVEENINIESLQQLKLYYYKKKYIHRILDGIS